jgi:hypothetical protein
MDRTDSVQVLLDGVLSAWVELKSFFTVITQKLRDVRNTPKFANQLIREPWLIP